MGSSGPRSQVTSRDADPDVLKSPYTGACQPVGAAFGLPVRPTPPGCSPPSSVMS
jgi:hypothetical protein